MDCSLPGSSVHGIFQARILEWGAIAFSCSARMYKSQFLGLWGSVVPFPVLFPSSSVSLRCHFYFPNQVFVTDVPPNQIKICHSPAMTSASVLFRYPWTLLPHASHRDVQPTGTAASCDKAWCPSAPAGLHLFIFASQHCCDVCPGSPTFLIQYLPWQIFYKQKATPLLGFTSSPQ